VFFGIALLATGNPMQRIYVYHILLLDHMAICREYAHYPFKDLKKNTKKKQRSKRVFFRL